MKVVINRCYGGFGLSEAAIEEMKRRGLPDKDFWFDIPRDHPILIAVVEELGEKAEGDSSDFKIVEVPDHVEWTVCEYDGMEWVAEKHRIWR